MECSLGETGRIPWNEAKYNSIKCMTAMERFGDPKKVEDGEVTFGLDIAMLKEMFDPLRKTEMKVGDIRHGRERHKTYQWTKFCRSWLSLLMSVGTLRNIAVSTGTAR